MEKPEGIISCRLCLIKCDRYFDIVDEFGIRSKIGEILMQHFPFFKIEETNEYEKICCSCWWKVESFHLFYLNIYNLHAISKTTIILPKLTDIIIENNDDNDKEIKEEFINQHQTIIDVNDLKSIENYTTLKEDNDFVVSSEIFHNEILNVNEIENNYVNNVDDGNVDYIVTKNSDGDDDSNDSNNSTRDELMSLNSSESEDESDDNIPLGQLKQKKLKSDKQTKCSSFQVQEEDKKIREYFILDCKLCSKTFERFAQVKLHYKDFHQLNGYVSCCNKKFFKRIRVLEHILRHLNPDAFKCTICNKYYADKPGLSQHLDQHRSAEEKTFKCEKCPRRYVRKYQLDQHQIRHITEIDKKFVCNDCGKAFASKSILQSHHRGVHENAYLHICEICAKVFKSKMFFEKHISEHSTITQPKVQCNQCGKYLKHEHSLRSHMARHEDEKKSHICKICNKKSPNRGALRSHIKFVHATERNFKCSVCEKAFKKAINLKEHMTIHTGEVLYNCKLCTRTFNSAANLHSHRKKMHRDEWEKTRKFKGHSE